mmetsp:Transcript_65349/g.155868  ORF Transcript_65349/g.155868 Transcript_65349/m.155868 type:complete len:425 (+) Transcript_65349:59-1333(+)|eukprot:CAMPEP_0180136376 /NCGR_PEP_ID=MMETSP0986-20121125/11463_1 /TAXON_ID=697907 /ORGANISM="non described non described, Strain CCMP2293" /LENGTH=424 /DNA_ID=CAMNT_0022077401 /DNA_START=46 /DNA_END=1320 /DNA_ORIENTATION=+
MAYALRALALVSTLACASAFLPVAPMQLRAASRLSSAATPFAGRTVLPLAAPQRRAASLAAEKVVISATVALPAGKKLKVGICGATGAVGKEIVGVLEKRNFPVGELRLFGSARSAGTKVPTKFGELVIEDFSVAAAREMDVVFVSVSGDFSLEHCNAMAEGDDGAVVIDNSSAFRYMEDIALCVPEINADAARKGSKKVIANPNCTTAIGVMALYPLHKKYGLKKVLMSTYQAASGAGKEGMDELFNGAKEVVTGPEGTIAKNEFFAHPLPFNLIPHIDVFQENLYTKEEMKVTWEIRKIFEVPNLPASCTAVRIPTFRAHAETIVIETEKPCPPDEARELLRTAPGLVVMDDPANKIYPMPVTASTKYACEVGRIRRSEVFGDNGLEFFVCGDQLLRGAALNAVLIAEALMEPIGKEFNPSM